MIRRIDPYTHEIFYAKRKNQRFANRKNQIAYNNQKAKYIRDLMAKIDNHIRNNWKILVDNLKEDEFVISTKDYLLGCGYNFKFFNYQIFIEGERYFCIYNYGITMIESGLYKIIKLEDNE
jgi:hypothetical protein